MAQQRATLASHDLADLHKSLTPSGDELIATAHPERVSADTGVQTDFPSLQRAAKREQLVSFSVRLPLSQVEALRKLEQDRGVKPSELVRDFIEACLPRVMGSED